MTISINQVSNINNTNTSLRKNNNLTNKTKLASAAGSIVGVASALTLISKKQGFGVTGSIKKTKTQNLLGKTKTLLSNYNKMELKEKDVIQIASKSIMGGVFGGMIMDPDNSKAKCQEGIIQLIGNYVVPTLFVGSGIKLNKVLNKKFNYPPITKPVKFLFGFTSLIAGVITGNKISKEINKTIFKENSDRKLNWKDWGLQFDNLCLVTSVSNSGTTLAKMASNFIPAAQIIPGCIAGTKQK